MKFEIERASHEDGLPCKNAILIGTERDPKFEIEINSLDELMELVDEVDDIVINKDKSITIYDDYLE